jgi:hypothetical protein
MERCSTRELWAEEESGQPRRALGSHRRLDQPFRDARPRWRSPAQALPDCPAVKAQRCASGGKGEASPTPARDKQTSDCVRLACALSRSQGHLAQVRSSRAGPPKRRAPRGMGPTSTFPPSASLRPVVSSRPGQGWELRIINKQMFSNAILARIESSFIQALEYGLRGSLRSPVRRK